MPSLESMGTPPSATCSTSLVPARFSSDAASALRIPRLGLDIYLAEHPKASFLEQISGAVDILGKRVYTTILLYRNNRDYQALPYACVGISPVESSLRLRSSRPTRRRGSCREGPELGRQAIFDRPAHQVAQLEDRLVGYAVVGAGPFLPAP